MKKSFLFISFFSFLACSNDFEVVEKVNHASRVASQNLYEITVDSTWNGMSFTQGNCSVSQAQNNLALLKHFIEFADSPDYDGLSIVGVFDCFFAVGSNLTPFPFSEDGINLPSNFTLQMSDATHLRVRETSLKHQLLGISEKENINIYGGHLHGERLSHLADSVKGNLLSIRSGRFINVEGTSFSDSNGDGLNVFSSHFAYQYEPGNPEYNPVFLNTESANINIKNCNFDRNRGQNLSITDGHDIVVEYCNFMNSSMNIPGISNGKETGFAIDIEAQRHRETEGDLNSRLILDQHAHHIIIRNCEESGSRIGAFIVSIGDNVTIENNNVENEIGFKKGRDLIIRGNKVARNLYSTYTTQNIVGISFGDSQPTNTVYNNLVTENLIENYPIGMDLYQKDCIVSFNKIANCKTGIKIRDIENFIIENNKIEYLSNVLHSNVTGIIANFYYKDQETLVETTSYIKDVIIRDNIINIRDDGGSTRTSYPFRFAHINEKENERNYKFFITNNDIRTVCMISMDKVYGATYNFNYIETGIDINRSESIIIDSNKILQCNNNNGINLYNSNYIGIKSNEVSLTIGTTDSNKCIYAPNNKDLIIDSNLLTDSKDSATIWLPSTTSSTIINNKGNIGAISSSPHFLYGMVSQLSGNVYSNNLCLPNLDERNWFYQ